MSEEPKIIFQEDNKEIRNYLAYYLGIKNPGYAVFLSGAWGSGKTWFIREFKDDFGIENFVHVSLYGVASEEQINEQIFQQLYPKLTSKTGKTTGKLVKATAGFFGFSLDDFDIREYLNIRTEKIFIFDDLERCDNPNTVLGVINKYIEHFGCRVIIIGEEDFLKRKDKSFISQKEKTIGRHFTIFPEFKTTFDFLINQDSHLSIKDVLNDNYSVIKSCFDRAECSNLRTLKFCITEFYRFYGFLPQKAKDHKEFLSEAVNTFFSLCVELRSGKLEFQDILKIEKRYIDSYTDRVTNRNSSEPVKPHPLSVIRIKHFGDGLDKIEPELSMLYCFFKYGSIHPRMMTEAIEGSSYFHVDNTPTWMKFWYSHSITDDKFQECYSDVIKKYKSYEYRSVGVLRHVAGMLLNYSKEQLIDMTYEDAKKLNLEVISEMISKKLIEPDTKEEDFRPFDDVSHGMQFQALNDENFIEISKLIKHGALLNLTDVNKEMATQLPSILKEDVHKFWSLIALSRNTGEGVKLYRYPIMKFVDVNEFVQAIIEMNPNHASRFTVLGALKDRYGQITSYPGLKEDLPWLIELKKKMTEIQPQLRQPTKNQFNYLLTNLDNIIKGLEDSIKQLATIEE